MAPEDGGPSGPLTSGRDDEKAAALRKRILDLVACYAAEAHGPAPFMPGRTYIPASGKVYGGLEMQYLVSSSLDFWLTSGRFAEDFERRLRSFVGARHALLVNSGSSANLLAISALTSPRLGEERLRPGDEVITLAAGFPTTVNPIMQNGLVPVFIDVELPTYNIDVGQAEQAISERTKAVMIAHTLGNPFNVDAVRGLAEDHGLFVIEDCCDALGSRYGGKMVGSFGDISTFSFYPAHHITTGEGGAVMTCDDGLAKALESMRDWGRDCHCPPGRDNTCGRRYDMRMGALPEGYDHKYIYSDLGYNLKMTDMQAAIGLAQMERLDSFIAARRQNFSHLADLLSPLQDALMLAEAEPKGTPSWFGFPITLRGQASGRRKEVLRKLEDSRIGSRLLFGGNLTKQPYMRDRRYRQYGPLANTDTIMNETFWLGVHPQITGEMLDYMASELRGALSQVLTIP
jgi:CDP-6-deoxy-D-xylo-4-hexulose-3-dehydrase